MTALEKIKQQAAASFEQTGYPTRKWERWKYTDLRTVERAEFSAPSATKAPAGLLGNAVYLPIINGQAQITDPDIKGLTIKPLSKALDLVQAHLPDADDFAVHPLLALNTAHLGEGLVIHVAKDTVVDQPVELSFFNAGNAAVHPVCFVILEEGATLTLFEGHAGAGAYFANHVNHFVIGQKAKLTHYRLQDEDVTASHIALSKVKIAAEGDFKSFAIHLGAGLSRHETLVDLLEKEAKSSLGGIFLVQNDQLCDTTIEIRHQVPDCVSHQNFRGIINDKARAVFQGKIHVSREAHGSDGIQVCHAILLSEQAEIDIKPELEIYADDVTCAHGATAGQIDPNSLFYLRSRGIPEAQARALLIEGFLSEVLDSIEDKAIAAVLAPRVTDWLHERLGV